MAPTLEEIRAVPKVVLHDHLDGGLRPATALELAEEIGYRGAAHHRRRRARPRFARGADRGNLELYLEPFEHTVALMQTRAALVRVPAECAEDLAADGVVYAEVRFAPELHVNRGLSLDDVVDAVLEGFRVGSAGRGIVVNSLLTAMRTAARSLEIAELAVRHRDREWWVSTSPAPRPVALPPATSTRSSTSSGRASTSRSTRARVSGCPRSGRRCSGARPTCSGTACGWWTT